jgi:hypothetical protein
VETAGYVGGWLVGLKTWNGMRQEEEVEVEVIEDEEACG